MGAYRYQPWRLGERGEGVLDRIYRMGRIGGRVPLVSNVLVVLFLLPCPLPPARVLAV